MATRDTLPGFTMRQCTKPMPTRQTQIQLHGGDAHTGLQFITDMPSLDSTVGGQVRQGMRQQKRGFLITQMRYAAHTKKSFWLRRYHSARTRLVDHPGFRAMNQRNGLHTFILQDHQVSRHHAKISYNSQRFAITDLASRNGTFVNGTQLTSEPHIITLEKDVITISNYTLRIQVVTHE
jgi:hypothetical protein